MGTPAADTKGASQRHEPTGAAMTFECTSCQLRYKIDDSLIPPEGARVKCRRCSTLIEVPAPVIELAPVDLELIPPPPPKRVPRVEEAPAERVPEPPPAPRVADPEPSAVDEGVTLEQQLAAEARSVPPSPDIEHDSSFVERFDAPPAATIPADPAFEHIGASAAQSSYVQTAPALETEPLGTPPQEPAFDPAPATETTPVVETSVAPSFGEPLPPALAPLASAPSIGEPSLGTPSIAVPSFAAPSITAPSFGAAPASLGAPTPESIPPEPPAPTLSASPTLATSDTVSGEAPMAVDNVVPLTLGTPIPDGLSPEEKTRHEKARRLARVLASDIAIYNREKKERGMVDGNLVAVLGYEIKKSWETYKERVGADFANSTPYFRDALNDLLAEGKKIF
jgi:predicted Zn finger-like uncharacterized protein